MNNRFTKSSLSKALLIAITPLVLVSCGSESIGDISSYDLDGSCRVVPEIEVTGPQPVETNGPITNTAELFAGIAFDDGSRVSGAMPAPESGTGLTFNNLVITDKSVQSLFVSGDVPEGKRIGAFFFQIEGVDEYFAVPIALGGETGASSGLPITVTMRGPVPIEGTEPEPDIIQNQIIGNIKVAAFLVDATAEAPDVSGSIEGSDDAANWLLSTNTELTITAENVGTGGMTATLFWNTATDIDLWMIEPNEHKIYYADRDSTAGDGFLDFDNVTGFGPENIFFTTDIPNGLYQVKVHYFSGGETDPVTNWSVSLTACGSTRAFSGTLEAQDEVDDVFSFTLSDNCSILPYVPPPKEPTIFEEAVICDPGSLDTVSAE